MISRGADGFADLHVHTDCSDGVYSPVEAVRQANKAGLRAISITDHDCTEAIDEAIGVSNKYGVEVIPGVEISARCEDTDIHILGYYIDHKYEVLSGLLDRIRSGRVDRIKRTIERLNDIGLDIGFKEVRNMAERGSFGRMQLARALVKKRLVPNVQTVFDRYISDNGPCYVPHRRVGYKEAINAIVSSGGVAVLAHPGTMGQDQFINRYIEAGLKGLEVYHARHSAAKVKKYIKLARERGLLITGGSDCHGAATGEVPLIGTSGVDYSHVEALRAASASIAEND